MSTTRTVSTASAFWMWTGRVIACFFGILGSIVFVGSFDTGGPKWRALAAIGVGGALLYIVGVESARRRGSRWIQLAGWLMMAALSLIPSSLLYLPSILVLFALPAVLPRFRNS
jgi:hypothetical protein